MEYSEGESEQYLLPLTYASAQRAVEVQVQFPLSVIASLEVRSKKGNSEGVLYEAEVDRFFTFALFEGIRRRRVFKGLFGDVRSTSTAAFRKMWPSDAVPPEATPMKAEQSNTSVIYGGQLILKLFRRMEEGLNPDLEIGRFITEKTDFTNIPAVMGALEYVKGRNPPMTIGILQSFVTNQGDAWQYTRDALSI
jgi:maltose alpha-D-glucosyltransferase/alpha-amylase